MAVSAALVSSGISLLMFLLNLIWGEEQTDKTGEEKHKYVTDTIEKWINDKGVKVKDLDGFIKGFVKLLKDHEIFD